MEADAVSIAAEAGDDGKMAGRSGAVRAEKDDGGLTRAQGRLEVPHGGAAAGGEEPALAGGVGDQGWRRALEGRHEQLGFEGGGISRDLPIAEDHAEGRGAALKFVLFLEGDIQCEFGGQRRRQHAP
jgi:hypothetical protein